MAGDRKYQAHFEEYHSDDSNAGRVVKETFSRNSSPVTQANVSTKRSKDLKTDQAPAAEKMPTNIDLRSDSGYSSFTAASKSSADSAPSASSRSPPVVSASTTTTATAPPVAQSPAPKPRRPTGGEQRQHSAESSPRQKLARTASVSKPRPAGQRRTTLTQGTRDNRDEECRDPNCTTCGPNALPQRRRPELQPSASTHSVPTYPSDQMSQRSAPDPYYSPPSPMYTRQAPPYASQGDAVVQTARTRRSSSVSRPRPQSFAGDGNAGYWAAMGMSASAYPSPPHERGPPPSLSAYQNRPMPNVQYGAQPIPPYMGGAPPGNFYGHPGQPYDGQQRPPPSARTASNFSQRGHTTPIITQEDPNLSKYSARYNHSQPPTPSEHHTRNPSLQQRKQLQLQYPVAGQDEASDSEYTESEEEYDAREVSRRAREAQAARELMPPPKIKRDQSQRRPPLAHAKTSQVVDRLESDRREKRRQSILIPDRSVQPERERERVRANAPAARRASVSRPPPPHRQTQSEYNTRQARVVVNDSRHNRRQSAYQVYEKAYDYRQAQAVDDQYNAERKREKRASRIVQEQRYMPGQFNDSDDEEEEQEVRVRALSRPRRKTESDSRKGKERTSEIKQKANDAEEYIKSTRGSREAYADQINKAALKRVTRVSQPSESGSSSSNGSGNRTTMTSTTNNEIRLRVDGTMPLSLQLSGDMEGRTLQLVPAENGMTDLVIGGNTRSGETVYRGSERSSVSGNKSANRRSIIAGQGRRDAEDLSERGSRGTRNRRDRDEIREVRDERGHVLRRSRTPAYH